MASVCQDDVKFVRHKLKMSLVNISVKAKWFEGNK